MNREETKLKLHPCHCGGEIKIEKVSQNGGMDGMFWNWKLICKKCGLTKTYAADGFYGRKYKTFEEVVGDWNRNREKEKTITVDVLDKIRAEIEHHRHKTQSIDPYDLVGDCLDIIDKYKAESEG